MVFSDVFSTFTVLDLQLQRHLDEELASNLRIAIRRRSDAVLKTTTMFACMYLDPRFQCMLNEAEKVIAKEHLTTLHRRITAADAIIERTLDQSMDDTLTLNLDDTFQHPSVNPECDEFDL